MARRIRYIIPKLPHHALQRGNNRQKIFLNQDDKKYFLFNLKKSALENSMIVGAYCLMINHVHLLLYPESQDEFIKFMKYISQLYTQYFNRKYNRTGKLWENRYKLNIVEPEYEWVVARYIDQNPIRAGIVAKEEDYRYSSARIHLLGENSLIPQKDIINGRLEDYREFLEERKEVMYIEKLEELRKIVAQEKAIGGERFIETLEKKFKVSFKIQKRGGQAKKNKDNNE